MAASQAHQTNNTTDGSEGPSAGNQTSDNRTRFFEHNKAAREILLRGQAGTDAVRNALDIVFASAPWQEQRGELDRFQLQGLIATVNEEDGSETFRCKFSECEYSNKESTNAVEHVRGSHFGNRPFLCTAPNCEVRGPSPDVGTCKRTNRFMLGPLCSNVNSAIARSLGQRTGVVTSGTHIPSIMRVPKPVTESRSRFIEREHEQSNLDGRKLSPGEHVEAGNYRDNFRNLSYTAFIQK